MFTPFLIVISNNDAVYTWHHRHLNLFDLYYNEWEGDFDRQVQLDYENANGDKATVFFECKDYMDGLYEKLESIKEYDEYAPDFDLLIKSGLVSREEFALAVQSILFDIPLTEGLPEDVDIADLDDSILNEDGSVKPWYDIPAFKEQCSMVFQWMDNENELPIDKIQSLMQSTFSKNDAVMFYVDGGFLL